MITPMMRFSVKKEPKIMNPTKYRYEYFEASNDGCWSTYKYTTIKHYFN